MRASEGDEPTAVTSTASPNGSRSGVQVSAHAVKDPALEIVELTVPGSLVYRELATRATAQVCKRLRDRGQTNEEFLHEAVSAIGEAFNNVVQHSYAGEQAGYVKLIFRMQRCVLEIEVQDDGVGFDPVDDPDLEVPGLHESGMGLFIMRAFMDEVEHLNGRPNRLRMTKILVEPAD